MGVKYRVNQNFFSRWSHDIAYVLGFWFADGSIEHSPAIRGKYIRVTSTDEEIINSIKVLLKSDHTVVVSERDGNAKKIYLLRIGDSRLFSELKILGVTERKSKTMHFPDIPKTCLGDFIRGYFDGDGCVYIEKSSNGNIKRLTSVFTSGSHKFLKSIQYLLHQHYGLTSDLKLYQTRGEGSAYQLRYSTRDSVKLFYAMYPLRGKPYPFLKRKHSIYSTYLKSKAITRRNVRTKLKGGGPLPHH